MDGWIYAVITSASFDSLSGMITQGHSGASILNVAQSALWSPLPGLPGTGHLRGSITVASGAHGGPTVLRLGIVSHVSATPAGRLPVPLLAFPGPRLGVHLQKQTHATKHKHHNPVIKPSITIQEMQRHLNM